MRLQECTTARALAGTTTREQAQWHERCERQRALLDTSRRISELLATMPRIRSADPAGSELTGYGERCRELWHAIREQSELKASLRTRLADYTTNLCQRIASMVDRDLDQQHPAVETFVLLAIGRELAGLGAASQTARFSNLGERLAPWKQLVTKNWRSDVERFRQYCREGNALAAARTACQQLLAQGDYLTSLSSVGDVQDPGNEPDLQWLREAQNLLLRIAAELQDIHRALADARLDGNLDRTASQALAACIRGLAGAESLIASFNASHKQASIRIEDLVEVSSALNGRPGKTVRVAQGVGLGGLWPLDKDGWRSLAIATAPMGEIEHYDYLRSAYQSLHALWAAGEWATFQAASDTILDLDPDDAWAFARHMEVRAYQWPEGGVKPEVKDETLRGLPNIRRYTGTVLANLSLWQSRRAAVDAAVRSRASDDVNEPLEKRLAACQTVRSTLASMYSDLAPPAELLRLREATKEYLRFVELQCIDGQDVHVSNAGHILTPDTDRLSATAGLDVGGPQPQYMRTSMRETARLLAQEIGSEPIPPCLSIEARKLAREIHVSDPGTPTGGLAGQALARFRACCEEERQLLEALRRKWACFGRYDALPSRPASAVRAGLEPLQIELRDLDLGDPESRDIVERPLPWSWFERILRILQGQRQ
ncbi:MAG: hypothetical protein ACUVX9_05190 [Anaerolineae bacterium]